MGKIGAILRLTRIEHSLLLVIAVIAAELIVGGGSLPAAGTFALSMITPIFISMGAFAINDYFDIKVDRLNKKARPLVTGEIKPREAIYITAACMSIGAASSLFINMYCFAIAVFFAVMSVFYSYRLKETLFWGNAYVALSMVIPFIYGDYVVGHLVSIVPYAVRYTLEASIVAVSGMIFASGLAREIHGTIRDLKGDIEVRDARTLPKVLGVRASAAVALLLYCVAILISAYLALYVNPFDFAFTLRPGHIEGLGLPFVALIGITDALLLYVGIGYLLIRNQKFYDKTRNVSLAAMGIALIALLYAGLSASAIAAPFA